MSMENYFSVDYWGLYPNSDINDIGLALNEQGVSGKFKSGEMGDAVRSIETGGGGSSGYPFMTLELYGTVGGTFSIQGSAMISYGCVEEWGNVKYESYSSRTNFNEQDVLQKYQSMMNQYSINILNPSNIQGISIQCTALHIIIGNTSSIPYMNLNEDGGEVIITFLDENPPTAQWINVRNPTIYCPNNSYNTYSNYLPNIMKRGYTLVGI